MRRFLAIMLASTLLATASCSLRKPPTGENYYQQGQYDFAHHEFNASIENYQKLIDYFPFSPYEEDAEMKIGLAYYQMKQYPEAVAALDDFQRMHPTSKDLDVVSYYIAMSYYDQVGREDQDQAKTEAALKRFEMIEQRFPEGSFAELARERADVCREMLARHQKVVSDYYFKRANFRAAESRLAELMQKYPDTPIAPDALYDLGVSLEKEGKKYSAAQAFSALLKHYPNTPYTARAKAELKKLHQPIDNEEDPLPLVLAESGFPPNASDGEDRVIVHQRNSMTHPAELASNDAGYGEDGLPILDRPEVQPVADKASKAGPATLRSIRLSSADPPLSVIFDLTGPVKYQKRQESQDGSSSVVLTMKDVTPDQNLGSHIVFDRSIFRDCDVNSVPGGTEVVLHTVPVANFAVVPLDNPSRLLVTFTPVSQAMDSP
ncbi:MAG TPA: outer membrane protein assembly factor BamD [Candidatus Binataceae bacterium]|nr:outer membrane protein assembly factor BamD [Candidatus Binataceae bacterium]